MLSCQKHLFYLEEDQHYLNCAYMSPLSRRVEEAGIRGMRRKRNPTLLPPEAFFEESHQARPLFARLVHADAMRVALVPSVSYGLATAARNLNIAPGQNLVVLHEQFPSNVYTWRRLAADAGATVRTIAPPGGPNRGARWNERILDAIDADTALVALGPVHWADGTRFDLLRIGERAREVGAALVVDGTQSVGALPFDVAQIQPDALVCAGYKWLFGPYSLGVAYYGPRFDDGIPLEENWILRSGSEDFSQLVHYQDAYQPGATRYDMGERSNFVLLPMLIAALEQILEWGPDNIQAYCANLTRDVLEEARALGFTVEDEAWRGAHLFGLRLPPTLSPDHLKQELNRRNIAVSVRGDAIRISPNVYNDAADIDALREALHASLHPAPSLHSTPSS